jgi:hypothetical protein
MLKHWQIEIFTHLLNRLAYNLKRMIAVLGVQPLIQAMRAA